MATVGGLSSGTSSSVSMYGASMRGFGGLASGLDTDSLIEGMTLGTRTKIQEALKKQTKYQWQMDSYRSVTDKLINFSKKYLDIGSANSPYRASFFDKTLATAKGANSKYLSVSGTSTTLDNMSVLGIKQLAKDTSLVTSNDGSNQVLSTGDINFGDKIISKLNGGNMTIAYGEQNYTLNFKEGDKIVCLEQDTAFPSDPTKKVYSEYTLDFSTAKKSVESMNKLMNSIDLRDNDGNVITEDGTPNSKPVKLGSKVKFELSSADSDANFKIVNHGDTEVNITGGSEATLKALGIMKDDGMFVNNGVIAVGGSLKGITTAADVATEQKFADFMKGKQITFSYNGVAKSIKLPDDATNAAFTSVEEFAKYLNNELASAFGAGKVTVSGTTTGTSPVPTGKLFFTTSDKSSIFKITDADKGIMGTAGVLGIGYATTNRLNREIGLKDSGLAGIPAGFGAYTINSATGEKEYLGRKDSLGNLTELGRMYDEKGNLTIQINGKDVKGLTVDSTLLQVTSAINSSDAGVKITYVETADRFSIEATNNGEAGKIKFGPDDIDGKPVGPTDFLKTLFGTVGGNLTEGTDYKLTEGQDAIMTVKYEGNVEVDIKRDTNSFNLDGATFNLSDTFGYTKTTVDGKDIFTPIADTEEITFSTAVDSDKVSKTIKELIDDYNKVLEETFKNVSTKPARDYAPLTDDEKSQLSASDIEKYEAKAKEGILFNDPLLRSLSDQLRSVFSGVTDIGTLKNMGIEMSGDYSSNGKITFDETKFKNALSENPEKVKELFTKPAVKDANGNVIDQGGFSVRLKSITDSYAKYEGLPKGSLVDKAGTTKSVTSVNKNALRTLMDDIDEQVDVLKDKLQIEIDRYTRQFSQLEQLVSQMNSQSSWLSQALGG